MFELPSFVGCIVTQSDRLADRVKMRVGFARPHEAVVVKVVQLDCES